MKETTFNHELTHTAQYQALGIGWYRNFVDKEVSEIISNFGNPTFSPYGGGDNPYSSPIIALCEGWAYYMGHFLADRRYGTSASCPQEQVGGRNWCNNTIGGTGHPHLDVEENFNPNLSGDPFHWIPQGLFYDLMDPANETIAGLNFVNDYVSGYTNAQLFSTFQSNIYTLQDYKSRLLQTVTNPTSSQVTGLFAQYHY